MKGLAVLAAAWALGLSAGAVRAAENQTLTTDRLLEMLRGSVVADRQHQVQNFLDSWPRRELDTAPFRNIYGDCRSQRITVWFRIYRPDDPRGTNAQIDHLSITNRYRRPSWARVNPTDEICDPVDQGAWIEADDDQTFSNGAGIIGNLVAELDAQATTATLLFGVTCAEMQKPCTDPLATLKRAIGGVHAVRLADEGRTVVTTDEIGMTTMRITHAYGRVQSVSVSIMPPPLV